jgi:hypothetical protein
VVTPTMVVSNWTAYRLMSGEVEVQLLWTGEHKYGSIHVLRK